MKTAKRAIALIELFMVFPAALFMAALFLRAVQPAAQTGRFVAWFARLPVAVGLDLLLVMLPFGAFVLGCATLVRWWRKDAEFREAAMRLFTVARGQVASLFIAGVTAMVGLILVLVAMHMITE